MITNLTESQVRDICKSLNIPFLSSDLPAYEEINLKLRDVIFNPYEEFYMGATENQIRVVENAFITGIVYGANYR